METLKTGSLAYFDTFAGIIPCKVLKIERLTDAIPKNYVASSSTLATIKLTATRGAYKRGEILQEWSLHVIPRKAVKGNRIKSYRVQVD